MEKYKTIGEVARMWAEDKKKYVKFSTGRVKPQDSEGYPDGAEDGGRIR